MKNIKMMLENINSPISLSYPNNLGRCGAGVKKSYFSKNMRSCYLVIAIATLLIGSVPQI